MKKGALEPIAALNRIRHLESGEPLVDIRVACPDVTVLERVCPYLRHTVAEMLNRPASSLPDGYRFRVGTAMRTLSMQKAGYDKRFAEYREKHPEWSHATLRRAVNRFHAPYDQPAPPGHCTGGAVDLGLLDAAGNEVDLLSPLDFWAGAYTWTEKISPQARANRMILVEAMLGAGFSNCREEFWHYSYGDAAWAVRIGEKSCPYGYVEPPVAVESGFEFGVCKGIAIDSNGIWRVEPLDGELFISLFWSLGKPLQLEIDTPTPLSLWRSADKVTWEPFPTPIGAGLKHLEITPGSDRLYLTTTLPPQDATQS